MCNGNEYEGRPYKVVTAKRYLYEEGMEPGYEIVPKDFNPYVGCAAGESGRIAVENAVGSVTPARTA